MTTEIETELEGDAILQELAGDGSMLLPSGYPYFQNLDAVTQKPDPKTLSATFTIVTRGTKPNRNRSVIQIAPDDGDTPRNRGMMLENYRRNPVVLFNHGMGHIPFPIGISEDRERNFTVKAFKSKMDATVFFAQSLPEAVQTYALVDENVLRTSSISFIPTRAKLMAAKRRQDLDDDEIDLSAGGRAVEFTEGDVIEWSVVDIPADPDAVRRFLDRGHIRGEKITSAMQRVMQSMAGAKPVIGVGLPEFKPYRFRERFGAGDQAYEYEVQCPTLEEMQAFVTEHRKQKPAPAVDQKPQEVTTDVATAAPEAAADVRQGAPPRPAAADIAATIKASIDATLKPVLENQESFAKELRRLTGAVD